MVVRGQLNLALHWNRSVSGQFHRVAAGTLSDGVQAGGISVELGQRHRAGDDHHAAGHVGGTGYLTSAAGEVARDVAHGAVRSNDLNVNDRFKDRRFSFGQGVKHGFSAGRDESNFLGVHRMALTVIDDNANVVDRVTGNIACIQSVTDTFFYSRDEVVRNCAAFDFVNEFETGSAFTRFNAKIDFTELAGAACLLLVASVTFSTLSNGFTVRDARCTSVDFKLELRSHSFENAS